MNADAALVVLCTAPVAAAPTAAVGKLGAAELARALVAARVCACVNLLPAVQSVFWWQGQVDTAEEVLLVIKTSRERYADLQAAVLQLHPYEVPELLALPVVEGLASYLTWLAAAMAPMPPA